jgi:hypothetical protein
VSECCHQQAKRSTPHDNDTGLSSSLSRCSPGHVDDAEEALECPIVSFSLGQSAVFLMGGPTKDEQPTAILLRSGDAVVMSGGARMCFHGAALSYDLLTTPQAGPPHTRVVYVCLSRGCCRRALRPPGHGPCGAAGPFRVHAGRAVRGGEGGGGLLVHLTVQLQCQTGRWVGAKTRRGVRRRGF